MNYERWGQSLGVDIMPTAPTTMPTLQPTQPSSTKTISGAQLVSLLPQLIAAGVSSGLVPSQPGTVPTNTSPQPDTGIPEVQCSDGYYRDATGLCQPMPTTLLPGQQPAQQSPAQPVASITPSSSMMVPILAFVGGALVGAGAMHVYMKPAKVTSNRGRVRRNRRRARR